MQNGYIERFNRTYREEVLNSYIFETLEEVRRQRPEDELFFLIGADSLADLPHWREPERIAALATVVVVDRPLGTMVQPLTPRWPDLGPSARPFKLVKISPIGIASNDLRQRVAEGRSIRYQVPRGVEAYIEAHGLYQK